MFGNVVLSHTLSKDNKGDRISIGTSLPPKQRNDMFLKNVITSDKKGLFFMANLKASGLTRPNFYSLLQRQNFMEEK